MANALRIQIFEAKHMVGHYILLILYQRASFTMDTQNHFSFYSVESPVRWRPWLTEPADTPSRWRPEVENNLHSPICWRPWLSEPVENQLVAEEPQPVLDRTCYENIDMDVLDQTCYDSIDMDVELETAMTLEI